MCVLLKWFCVIVDSSCYLCVPVGLALVGSLVN